LGTTPLVNVGDDVKCPGADREAINQSIRCDAGDIVVSPRQELYEKLCQQIDAAGGWVTSVPGADTLRFEIPERSALPEQLRAAGWSPLHLGTGTRVAPGAVVEMITVHSTGKPFQCRNDNFMGVDVYDLKLTLGRRFNKSEPRDPL
jgi:hypothetical protein